MQKLLKLLKKNTDRAICSNGRKGAIAQKTGLPKTEAIIKVAQQPRTHLLPVFRLANWSGRGGRREELLTALRALTVRDAFCLAAKRYAGRQVWCGGCLAGGKRAAKPLHHTSLFSRPTTYEPLASFPLGKLDADVAVCFAGFVQFLLSNKNCTRAADEFYLADKGFPPALSATPFALLQNAMLVVRFDSGAVLLVGCGRTSTYIIPACFPARPHTESRRLYALRSVL